MSNVNSDPSAVGHSDPSVAAVGPSVHRNAKKPRWDSAPCTGTGWVPGFQPAHTGTVHQTESTAVTAAMAYVPPHRRGRTSENSVSSPVRYGAHRLGLIIDQVSFVLIVRYDCRHPRGGLGMNAFALLACEAVS